MEDSLIQLVKKSKFLNQSSKILRKFREIMQDFSRYALFFFLDIFFIEFIHVSLQSNN